MDGKIQYQHEAPDAILNTTSFSNNTVVNSNNHISNSIFGNAFHLGNDSATLNVSMPRDKVLVLSTLGIRREYRWPIDHIILDPCKRNDFEGCADVGKKNPKGSKYSGNDSTMDDSSLVYDVRDKEPSYEEVSDNRITTGEENIPVKYRMVAPKAKFARMQNIIRNIKDGDVEATENGQTLHDRDFDIFQTAPLTKECSSVRIRGCNVIPGRYDNLAYLRNETVASLFEKGQSTVETINALMKERGSRGEVTGCLSILAEMKQIGVCPNTETYNNILLGCVNTKNDKMARYIYLCLKADVLEPDLKTYTLLIKAHAEAGDLASSFALYRKMEQNNIKADLVVYTVLINALVRDGQVESAWELYNYMRTWRLIDPDQVVFGVMIRSCVPSGNAEKALQLFEEMIQMKLYPTNVVYEELIDCLSRRKEYFHECIHFYNQLKTEQHPVSPRLILHLMRACELTGDIRKAKSLLAEAQQTRIPITEEFCIALIRVFAKQMALSKMSQTEKVNNLQKVWRIIQTMVESSMAITTKLLNSLIFVYENGGYHDYALDVLEYYPSFNVKPDHMTYFILLRMLGPKLREPGRFFTLWNAAKQSITPGKTLFCMALDMAIKSRSAKRTLEILGEMYAARVFPTPQLVKRLYACGKHITDLHIMINNLVALRRQVVFQQRQKESALIDTYTMEHRLKTSGNV